MNQWARKSGVKIVTHLEYEMNLSIDETQTIILALREYREHWNTAEERKQFDKINALMRKHQAFLGNQQLSYDCTNERWEKTLPHND
tara:strand:- start:234 stop:494 length:261 start_codon:yes stop_codon:yes gene_type:complete